MAERVYVPIDSEEIIPEKKERKSKKDFNRLMANFSANFLTNEPVKEKRELFLTPLSKYLFPPLTSEIREKMDKLKAIADSIERGHGSIQKIRQDIDFTIDYESLLNNAQLAATITTEGAVLVIAGAGSGKTRTLIYRIAYMIECGIEPESILVLTFTRKAAQEIVERASILLGDKKADKAMSGTFHAFANFVLRKYSKILGLNPNFTISDQGDSEDIVDLVKRELSLDKKKLFPRKSTIAAIISKSRNLEIEIEHVVKSEYPKYLEFIEDILVIANVYKKFKASNSILDYDDLMDYLYLGLKDNPLFLQKIHNEYKYIMVDEFQDTNVVQKKITDLIAQKSGNIMVVGDDSQSIYAFRGAHFENILLFPETYPDCRVIKLEENYRSNQPILNYTNAIVENACIGYKKKLFSTITSATLPHCKILASAEGEALFITETVLALREKLPFSEIAVLYRSSFHSNFIQAELMKNSIPFQVFGGIKFIERMQVKDIIAYLRITQNPLDAVSWNRILKLLPGIGNMTASSILQNIKTNNGVLEAEKFSNKKYGGELLKLASILRAASTPEIGVDGKIQIIKAHYIPILKTLESDYEERIRDIEILIKIAEKYEKLEKFLTDFALDPPSTKFSKSESPFISEFDEAPMTLSTVHSAKGLEWNTVFVAHLLDGFFPTDKSLKKLEYLEEERRLFYVACSRAKENLYLTLPASVYFWDGILNLPSRFLLEIGEELYDG